VERSVLCVWCKRTKLERSNGEREYVSGKERITSMSQAHLFVIYVEKKTVMIQLSMPGLN